MSNLLWIFIVALFAFLFFSKESRQSWPNSLLNNAVIQWDCSCLVWQEAAINLKIIMMSGAGVRCITLSFRPMALTTTKALLK